MNICFVCNEYPEGPHGGVGTMTQLLAEELVSENHSVKVIGVYDLSYPSPGFEVRNGVEITRIKVKYKSRLAVLHGNWLATQKIRYWIKKGLVDIIESPDSYGMFSLFAWFKKPLVLRANGNNTYFSSILKIPLKKNTAFYERNLYRKASGVCAVSAFTAGKMKLIYNIDEPVSVIYNAVEVGGNESELPAYSTELLKISNPIVFSGTLTQKKGIYELVKAVVILLNKGIELTLIINGKDSLNYKTGQSVKKELMELIPAGYNENFRFNGHVTRNELITQYKYSKAAVFPSFAEAFAFAPMEAMAVGIPTIYSLEGSGKELIVEKEDGLLVDPSSEQSIAQAIEYILHNPEKAIQIGENGRKKIELNFSRDKMAAKTIAFYEQVLNSFSKRK